MDYSRIAGVIDIEKLQASSVTIVGAGASKGLIEKLLRCGCRRIRAIEFDQVAAANIPRQQYDTVDIGRAKLDALGDALVRIDPAVDFTPVNANFLAMTDAEIDEHFSDSQLAIFATDNFAAQLRGNEVALRLGIPALWIGLYENGLAGEIIFWHSGIDACFRCLCSKRYREHASARDGTLDPASDGCSIFQIEQLDSIAGMLAIGLLTRGSDKPFGRLIDALGDRNFLQVQLLPDWSLGGVNPVRKHLGVAADCPAFFAWNTIVRADPDGGRLPCPDCEKFRGHTFQILPHYSGIPFVRKK